ncbi:NRDE family protein [Azospirillum halopraeferens]|uniref:NRDE family protein n=1 Tax=Azospirillum halopraeferens TaxID=34010 RepID=UPI0003FEC8BE|nr:NRDE family protein [Azospirillum halopraeferens]
MCSVIILRRPDAPYPVVLGANRDEMADRPWKPPGRHWADRPNVVAGLDELAGGSWLGLNDEGVVAAVLNRTGTLGPLAGKRSRGELVLEALDHADAAEAAMALAGLDTRAYRPFNLLIADNRDAYVVMHRGDTPQHRPAVATLGEGLHMVTAVDPDDEADPRIRLYLPLFRAAVPPGPDATGTVDWGGWPALLGSRIWEGDSARGAMDFLLPSGFGTSSGALIALPSVDNPDPAPVWHFAAGRPHESPWRAVNPSG